MKVGIVVPMAMSSAAVRANSSPTTAHGMMVEAPETG